MKKRIFLICPVARATPELKKRQEDYVAYLEKNGYEVHWPHRDTNQVDPTGGVEVCKTNFRAILDADEIHIWYDETSGGSKFDMGGVFMLSVMLDRKKKIVIVNRDEVVDNNAKSFFKIFCRLEDEQP